MIPSHLSAVLRDGGFEELTAPRRLAFAAVSRSTRLLAACARAVLILAIICSPLLLAVPASASVARECPQRAAGPAGVKALIRCAAPRLGVSTSKALSIARRESRFEPWQTNHQGSSACGVYQVVRGTWTGSLVQYDYGSLIDSTPFEWQCKDGRANVILSLRYVRHHGWGPWL